MLGKSPMFKRVIQFKKGKTSPSISDRTTSKVLKGDSIDLYIYIYLFIIVSLKSKYTIR